MKKLLIILSIACLSCNAQPDLKSYSETKYQNDIDSLNDIIVRQNDVISICSNELNREYYIVGGDSVRVVFAYDGDSLFYKAYLKNGTTAKIVITNTNVVTENNISK